MSLIASSTPIRAVIIDGPETGQIITLDPQGQVSPESSSAADVADRIEKRITRVNSKAQEMVAELRRINAQFKELA